MEPSIATAVRRAHASDTVALTDLVNRAYEVESAFIEGQRTSAAEIEQLIRAGGFLVLEYAGGIGAAILVQGPGERPGVPPEHAYFGMLSVLPELQGMGLGRRLVQVAEALAEAAGATSMTIRVINLREELSRWYRSLGYREVGTSPYASEAPGEPAPLGYNHRSVKRACHFIEMAKPLLPAAPSYTQHQIGLA
ncbi:MAG: GNAT family N-acetyltransferase [Myxococcales bacterium]|nr:GNAT family N-acetyltransferase [Myxococcales bacterium]